MASAYLTAQAENGPATPYLVHLLLDEAVPLPAEEIASALRARLGRVEPVEEGTSALHFYLPDYLSTVGAQKLPLQLALLTLEGIPVEELAGALRQSWTWPDAGEVAARCRASLTLTDFFGAGVDRRVRLAVFHGAASALLELLPIRALQWLPSQQVLSPAHYRQRLAEGEGLVGSAINVRRFRLPSEAAQPPVHVLDTVGLGAFGLPDLQLRFAGLDPAAASEWLYRQATALFEEGPGFAARGALPSPDGSEEWRLEATSSAAPPTRAVLDLRAGRFAPPGA